MPNGKRHSLPQLVLNLPAIAGRSEADVAACLGSPDPGAESTSAGRTKRSYWAGTVEVVFVDGKAAWIKLYSKGNLPYSKDALTKLGLPAKRPTYVNGGETLSWHDLPHLREVTLFGGGPGGTASAVLVCVQALPKPTPGSQASPAAFRPHPSGRTNL